MATPRDTRRLALICLYQIDQADGPGPDPAWLAESLDDVRALGDEGLEFVDGLHKFTGRDRERAAQAALDAWADRDAADAAMLALAPDWPAHRQAAIDRCILRLAHRQMHDDPSNAAAVINEAVELAKAFSTEKSPGFVNALLDQVLKHMPEPSS